MTDWRKDSPDWTDAGKMVQLLCEDRTCEEGRLVVDDFFPTADGDEVPVFGVDLDDGSHVSIFDYLGWRLL